MDHDHHHHHADMVTRATTARSHVHHMVQNKVNTSSTHSGHRSHHDMTMMGMTFHGGFTETILFDQWNTNSTGAFIGSWFLIFSIAILYEGLKTVRDHLAKREAYRQCAEESGSQTAAVRHQGQEYERPADNDLLPGVRTKHVRTKRARLLSLYHVIQTILHILQMGISYLLMLIAMTFNVYLFLAVILGAGLGHFLFGWRRSSVIDYNEHCQ